MSPKSGKAGSAVSPIDPTKAEDADKADPGEVEKVKAEQRQTKSGKYGSEKTEAHKPPQNKEEKEKKTSWIEFEMVGEDDKPIPGVRYKVTLPDDTVSEGSLNEKGFVKIDGCEPGTAKITFPDLDGGAWEKI
jgi:type VI secretion system secreted protein VgrG